MKIKETIERECCVPDEDFIKLDEQSSVCRHCFQVWIYERRPGEIEAGWYRDYSLKKLMKWARDLGEQP